MILPNYSKYLALLAMRDQGLDLVLMVVGLGLIWLVIAKGMLPQLLPILRWALVALFFASIPIMFMWSVK